MARLAEKEMNNKIFMLNFTLRKVLGGVTLFAVFTDTPVALIA